MAGVALIAWRLCLAASLLGSMYSHPGIAIPTSMVIATVVVVAAVVPGSFMPVSCILAVALQLAFAKLTGWPSPLATVIEAVQTLALGVLGAGAYSVDALIFGRREVVIARRP